MSSQLAQCRPDISFPFNRESRTQQFVYFVITVLGFSFWFFMVVPFASHRESYEWLAWVHSYSFAHAFSFISKSYRPLAQATTWLGFQILDPGVFPTSILRQTLLQGFVYGMFVVAWWFIYTAATERRLFAIMALLCGCVFFPGYVQLFHIYGIFYVPVMLTLGAVLHLTAAQAGGKREMWWGGIAILLLLWHPFATALFLGFYCGFYFDTFRQRTRAQHLRAIAILLVVAMMVAVMAAPVRPTEKMSITSRLFGFLVSYRTNEVNRIASVVAFLLTQIAVFSMPLESKPKLAVCLIATALSIVFFLEGLPLLLLWFCVVLIKLILSRCWRLFFLMLAAALLPFGGGIGTPIYGLFAIIVAAYVTAMGWAEAEKTLSVVKTRYALGIIIVSALVILLIRAGIRVPVVTTVASPLLTERERTYQLESVLAWLHTSEYCGYDLTFIDNAGNPIDSVESAIRRQNRPPAGLKEVHFFWNTVLRCREGQHSNNKDETAIVTFGGPVVANSRPVFEVRGRYAGNATVWISDPRKGPNSSGMPAASLSTGAVF